MVETGKKTKDKQLMERDMVSRSNVLIESKSSTSLFERKLLNIAISKAERGVKGDFGTCCKY